MRHGHGRSHGGTDIAGDRRHGEVTARQKICRIVTSRKKMIYVVIPLTHHKNSGYTELKVLGVRRSIILLFTAFLVGVLKG